MFCHKCGSELKDGAHFCSNCGVSLGESSAAKGSNLPKIITLVMLALMGLAILIFIAVFVLSGTFSFGNTPEQETLAPTEIPEEISTEPVSTNPIPEGNLYRDCYTDDEYILSDSHSRYYAPSEIQSLSDEALSVAYAEISARHGVLPTETALQEYFNCLSWFTPGGDSQLNTYEEQNLFLIDTCMRQRDGSIYRNGNPYMAFSDLGTTYLMPNSDNRYLTGNELHGLSKEELIIARNEIFARHGYIFGDDVLREYFFCENWYIPSVLGADFDSSVFNDQESANIKLIQVYEEIASGVSFSADNPYAPYYNRNYEYIFYDSNTRLLHETDIMYLSIPELIIARNEIFARQGYCFTDDHLMEYFLQCSWYHPQVAPGRADLISMNSTQTQNVNFLLDYQDKKEEMSNMQNLDSTLNYYVETYMFSLYLPAYWKDYCTYNSGDGALLTFRERLSYESIYCGHLFTITTYTSPDFDYLPSYDFLGQVVDPNGNSLYLVVIYPTDVQFDMPYMELYRKMADQRSQILSTIVLKEGYTFVT